MIIMVYSPSYAGKDMEVPPCGLSTSLSGHGKLEGESPATNYAVQCIICTLCCVL